jgi:hypothetical protein
MAKTVVGLFENSGLADEVVRDLEADENGRAPNIGVSSQGALPVLSIPGDNETDSKLAGKNGKDTNAEVSAQGALPVISVPGGSPLR